jgi:branched-chain amino acid transport system substrate-binding protein
MSFGPEVANFAKQAKELGINKQIVTYETFNSPTSLEIAGNAANGIIFCSPQFNKDSDNKSINELKAKVLEKYNHNEMNFFIAAHYDAIMLLINAISRGNKTGKEIKEYFDEMNTFNGITGPIKFNNKGGAIVPLQLYKVENNEFITIK